MTFYVTWKILNFYEFFWVITCGIKAQGSDTRPECGSTCVNEIVNLNKYTDVIFFWMIFVHRIMFSELTIGMDRLEKYADEETPYIECNIFPKEPIQ